MVRIVDAIGENDLLSETDSGDGSNGSRSGDKNRTAQRQKQIKTESSRSSTDSRFSVFHLSEFDIFRCRKERRCESSVHVHQNFRCLRNLHITDQLLHQLCPIIWSEDTSQFGRTLSSRNRAFVRHDVACVCGSDHYFRARLRHNRQVRDDVFEQRHRLFFPVEEEDQNGHEQ